MQRHLRRTLLSLIALGGLVPPCLAAPSLPDDEAAVSAGRLSRPDQLAAIKRIASFYASRAEHRRTLMWTQRYVAEGGSEAEVRPLAVGAYFHLEDYANAARGLQFEVQASERAGAAPPEERLQWLLTSYRKLNDNLGAAWALEKLVTHHPRKAYWSELLMRIQQRKGLGDRLALDVMRLRLATDTLGTAEDYVQMATMSLQVGQPAEAKKVVDHGFAASRLGQGTEADKHRALRDQVHRAAADDAKRLALPDTEVQAAAAPDGSALVALGLAHAMQGGFAKGSALMEQGLRKGVVSTPQDAKLRLGMVYWMAAQNTKALDVLRGVGGRHGAGDLARLWELFVRQS